MRYIVTLIFLTIANPVFSDFYQLKKYDHLDTNVRLPECMRVIAEGSLIHKELKGKRGLNFISYYIFNSRLYQISILDRADDRKLRDKISCIKKYKIGEIEAELSGWNIFKQFPICKISSSLGQYCKTRGTRSSH